MKALAIAAAVLSCALPVLAQSPDPAPEPEPEPQDEAPPPPEEKPKTSIGSKFFFGGGVGASFGTVDYVSIAPMVGYRVVPRVDVGLQPFYQWTRDGRYATSVSTTDYGVGVFTRVRIVYGLFAEGDYQYTNFEYVNSNLTTTRDTHNAFLAGGGYSFAVGRNVGFYASALYDFTYDSSEPYGQYYDSPVRLQVGVSVGF
jgi:hypothetical protein